MVQQLLKEGPGVCRSVREEECQEEDMSQSGVA